MARRMVKSPQPERYLQRSREILCHTNRLGLHHDLYLLFNFPGKTPQTVAATHRFVEELSRSGHRKSGVVSAQTFFIAPGTEVYGQRERLERELGAELRTPDWRRRTGDQYAMATDVQPSAAWRGRDSELRGFQQWQLQMNFEWLKGYSMDTHTFRMDFQGWSLGT